MAKDIGVPTLRISQIVCGQRAVTAVTTLRRLAQVLACAYFTQGPRPSHYAVICATCAEIELA